MNSWLEQSIAFANQRNYLDELFRVYPTIPEGIREIDKDVWHRVESAFSRKDNPALIHALLDCELFPIKDSYVAFLRRDRTAIDRNPQTVNRLCGRLYEMGLNRIYEKCTEPKETNRQIGPLFRRWLKNGGLGIQPVGPEEFIATDENAILDAGDAQMLQFAREHLRYRGEKGLDFIARFNGRYVIGEAKFLTDFGGHQNAQFNDAITTLQAPVDAISVAILDGVLYIEGNNKMYRAITGELRNETIMSALLLREFLYQL